MIGGGWVWEKSVVCSLWQDRKNLMLKWGYPLYPKIIQTIRPFIFFCIETIMVTWRSPMTLRTPHVVVGFFHQTSIYSGFSPSFPTFQSSFQVERPDFLFSNVDRFRKRKASAAPKAMGPGGWNILKLYNMGVFHKW